MAVLTREDIRQWLVSQGFQPEERSFGYHFRYQMLNYYIEYDQEEDDQYLRVIMPGIYDMDENNRLEVLSAANEVDSTRKVIKCFVPDDSVHIAAELLVDQSPDLGDIIPRAIRMLQSGRDVFYEALKK